MNNCNLLVESDPKLIGNACMVTTVTVNRKGPDYLCTINFNGRKR